MKVCNTSRVIDKIVVAVLFDLLPLFRRTGFVFFSLWLRLFVSLNRSFHWNKKKTSIWWNVMSDNAVLNVICDNNILVVTLWIITFNPKILNFWSTKLILCVIMPVVWKMSSRTTHVHKLKIDYLGIQTRVKSEKIDIVWT